MPQHSSLHRRHFLRGLGAMVALPLMESLASAAVVGPSVPMATTATGAPLRTAFLYFPNGAIPEVWCPKGAGTDYQLSKTLKSLEKHKSNIQVMGGLENKTAEAGMDGGGDHARGNGTFLTGVRLKKSATDIKAGVSIDQVLAQEFGHLTRFPSLELTCDNTPKSGGCDSGYSCAYQFNISWSSATTPKTAESNPRRVFERLFGTGKHGERQANLERRQQEEKSILDFVLDDAKAMQSRLDSQDRSKLDQYLTGIREIETRIRQSERFGAIKDPAVETPVGISTSYGEHIQHMFDLLTLAFQTDSTRVATLLLAHDGSNRSFDHIGITEGHHDLTHHMNRKEWIDKVADIDEWYVQQLSKFLDRLQTIQDVDGKSLLHNSMILYGSGNADGNSHTHRNLPVLLAGGGGGALHPGRYVQNKNTPLTNLYVGMAQVLGANKVTKFGDSTKVLTDL